MEIPMRGDIAGSPEQEWKCWICEKDKTGMIDLAMRKVTGLNIHSETHEISYDVCLGCLGKILQFVSLMTELHLADIIGHLRNYVD